MPCVSLDWMEEASKLKPVGLVAQESVRSDDAVQDILDALAVQPVATDLEVGQETFAWVFDQSREDRRTARELLLDVCRSERGRALVKGDGTFHFEDRHYRSLNPTVQVTLDNDMTDVLVPVDRDDVVNEVHVSARPTRVDAAATTVLYSVQSVSALIAPGESLVLFGPYRDPDNPGDRVGGTEMVTPVATTDYTMNTAADGSGTDLTASFSVSASFTGSGARFTITNNHATSSGYLTKLQARGKGIYRFTATVEVEVAGSYGERILSLDLPLQSNLNKAQDVATYYSQLLQAPFAFARTVRFLATGDTTRLTQALVREPGDRIALTEDVTGLAGHEFTINAVRLELEALSRLWCTWTLEPTTGTRYWLMGVAGASEVGETTVWGW